MAPVRGLTLPILGSLATLGTQAAEISAEDYYGNFDSLSLENTSYDEVRKLLLQGRPFVIRDGARGLPMESWDCNKVKQLFPESRIRQEGGESDVNGVKMSSDWTNTIKKFAGADQFPEGSPQNRPFYWDIAKAYGDEKHRKWGKNAEKVVSNIVDSTGVPYWLPAQESESMGTSSEMWFHPKGAGAPAHMDPHCQSTVSYCFSGKRKWRMMMPPADPHPEGYFDGQIYGVQNPDRKGEWQPTFEFEAPAGSAIVVFPGMIHETLSTGEDCSSSVSQTFQIPVAAAYFRAFWPRFSLIHEDVGMCADLVEGMVALGSGTRVKSAKESKAQASAAEFAARVDTDGDGVISVDEIQKVNNQRARGEKRSVEELISFHDVDADGIVTVKELEASWTMFSAAARRLKKRMKQQGERGEL